MKKIICSCFLIMSVLLAVRANTSFGKDVVSNQNQNFGGVSQPEDHPLKNVFGKKLSVGHHTVKKAKIGHKGTDYMLFNEDGTFEKNWNNLISKGTWSYDANDKTITLNEKTSARWNIKEVRGERITFENQQTEELIVLFYKP